MEKRVLIAIFLCFLSLYLWQAFVVKPVAKPGTATPTTTTPATAAVTVPPANVTPSPLSSAAAAAVPPPPVAGERPLVSDTQERDVRVETRDVIAVFTNRGARLKSWRLKRYLDQERQAQELVVALDSQPLPFALHEKQ